MADKRVRKVKERTKELPWREKPKIPRRKKEKGEKKEKLGIEMPEDRIIKSCKHLDKVQPLIFQNGSFRRKIIW